jgi:hypothetical protein
MDLKPPPFLLDFKVWPATKIAYLTEKPTDFYLIANHGGHDSKLDKRCR